MAEIKVDFGQSLHGSAYFFSRRSVALMFIEKAFVMLTWASI